MVLSHRLRHRHGVNFIRSPSLGIGTRFAHYNAGSIGGCCMNRTVQTVSFRMYPAGACSWRGPDVVWSYCRIGPARRRGARWALCWRRSFRPFVLRRRRRPLFRPIVRGPQLFRWWRPLCRPVVAARPTQSSPKDLARSRRAAAQRRATHDHGMGDRARWAHRPPGRHRYRGTSPCT